MLFFGSRLFSYGVFCMLSKRTYISGKGPCDSTGRDPLTGDASCIILSERYEYWLQAAYCSREESDMIVGM